MATEKKPKVVVVESGVQSPRVQALLHEYQRQGVEIITLPRRCLPEFPRSMPPISLADVPLEAPLLAGLIDEMARPGIRTPVTPEKLEEYRQVVNLGRSFSRNLRLASSLSGKKKRKKR
jgi:hypothetical protein